MKCFNTTLSLFLLAIAIASVFGQSDPIQKQGVGYWNSTGTVAGMFLLQPSWAYDWNVEPMAHFSSNIEFVPMIWGIKSVDPTDLAKAKHNGKILLGFNEPDESHQSNIDVEQALDAWPQLEATEMRLGSPAAAGGYDDPHGWLARFMDGVKSRGYRVDFICVHDYQGGFDSPEKAAEALCSKLNRIHQLYGKPIWLTEFALANWHNPASEDQQAAYAKAVIPQLEKIPYLERYAWFALPPDANGDNAALSHANLCTVRGDLTPLGIQYRDSRYK